MRKNPFLEPYNTPHGTTPFDRIEEQDFEPALEEGMRREDAEIEAIVSNADEPTFENTVLALERSGELLARVETVMGNLLSACTSDYLEALAQKMAPRLSEHSNRIMLNEQLFARIKAQYIEAREGRNRKLLSEQAEAEAKAGDTGGKPASSYEEPAK